MRRERRTRKSRSGTAMVEAAIMLPVFGILFLSVIFAARLYQQAPRAREQARRCAMLYADSGCRTVPEGCHEYLGAAATSEHDPGSALLRDAESGSSPELSLPALPGLGDAIDQLFGELTAAHVPWRLPLPMRDRSAGGLAHYTVLCGQGNRTARDIAMDTFCQLTGLCDD